MSQQHLGIIGLGVMGRNLALNAESQGFSVAGYDADREKAEGVAAEVRGKKIAVANSLEELVSALETPRRIWVMVPAGKPVDAVLDGLKPLLDRDDIVLDGGNSHFKDTERRAKDWERDGLRFFGMGVSGGEEGALRGPCLMPGGHEESYRHLEALLTRMAAHTGDGPCCAYLGPRGAGHYVKMVHNGIEYGIMQLLCEAYDLLRRALNLSSLEVRDLFDEWNRGELNSFLLEISSVVLGRVDPETGKPLVDLVLDTAEQKGTGKWAAQDAMDLGVAVPTLTAAVEARILSSLKQERVAASDVLRAPAKTFSPHKQRFIAHVRHGLLLSGIACYAQGFAQLRAASKEYAYSLNLGEIARIWKGGCIIRARLLDPIQAAFGAQEDLKNLLVDGYFSALVNERAPHLRAAVAIAAELGIPALGFASALGYIDSYRQARLPANLLQAQRDYFGAHTYRRIDKEGDFHTAWDK